MSHVLADASGFWHRHGAALSHPAKVARHRSVAAPPALARGERVLRRYTTADSQLIATDRALYERIDGESWRRIRWVDIAVVGWSRVERAIVLRLWPTGTGAPDIRIAAGSAVAAFVEDRCAAARVLVRHVELRPGVVATIVALRDDDRDVVRWQLLVAGGEPDADEELRKIAQRVMAEIRGIAGC